MRIMILVLATLFVASCTTGKKKAEPAKAVAKKQDTTKASKTDPQPQKSKLPKVAHRPLWSYSGLMGPELWGDLKSEFAMCKKGKAQSPIDLLWTRPSKKGDLKLSYMNSDYKIEDNGHTIKAMFAPGNKVTLAGVDYELVQLHFHAHSEHAISGKFYPLEAHFVHKDAKGNLAVLGVLFVEGKANSHLESMWQQLPKNKHRKIASTKKLNPKNLLPAVHTHYHYTGSLTTPPCSEGVHWNVFNTPVELSKEQLNHFKTNYASNFRPLQPRNNRKVINF